MIHDVGNNQTLLATRRSDESLLVASTQRRLGPEKLIPASGLIAPKSPLNINALPDVAMACTMRKGVVRISQVQPLSSVRAKALNVAA